MPNLIHNMSVTLGNMPNLGFMNCQTKVVILDLNCDFRMIKQICEKGRIPLFLIVDQLNEIFL
jgi:hypothetical protein